MIPKPLLSTKFPDSKLLLTIPAAEAGKGVDNSPNREEATAKNNEILVVFL